MIKIKRSDGKEEAGPTPEEETTMRAQAEALETSGGELEEAPPETGEETLFFNIMRKNTR